MGNGGIGRGCRMADDMEIWRGRRDLVSMRHPYLQNPTPISGRTTGRAAFTRKQKNVRRTSISSPSPSNKASADDRSLPNLLICTRAKPYSRCEHFATVPPRFHAISWTGNEEWDVCPSQKGEAIVSEGTWILPVHTPVGRSISLEWAHQAQRCQGRRGGNHCHKLNTESLTG